MRKVWNFLKDNSGWVYGSVFAALTAWSIAVGDEWYWIAMDATFAALSLYLYQYGPFRRPPTGGTMPEAEPAVEDEEPTPAPEHTTPMADCQACKDWMAAWERGE